MRPSRSRFAAGLLLTIAVVAPIQGQAPAPQDRAKLAATELDQGQLLVEHKEYFEGLKRLRRANELLGNRCGKCLASMAEAMIGMKAYANAVETAQSALDAAGDDQDVLGSAHIFRGQAFEAMAASDATKLKDAEAEYRQAVATALPTRLAEAHFYLGIVLMKQQRDDEGVGELQQTIKFRPDSFLADDAASYIANPRRARENYAPDFSITVASGDKVTLESVRGRIVLLDFWASWCQPCVKALPALQKLQKTHAGDPFVMLAISADEDELTWRRFTAKNNMVWPQFFDGTRTMASRFRVTAYPTYVLLDGEGLEVLRVVGTGFHDARQMDAAITAQLARLAAGAGAR